MAASEGEGSSTSRSLQDTPVWALATVCFVFISISIFMEHLIHLLSNWLRSHRKTALFEALEKLKSVLILLGFMSLILAGTQRYISKICIPITVADTMLPCRVRVTTKTTKALGLIAHIWTGTSEYYLPGKDDLENVSWQPERRLAAAETSTSSEYCDSKGKTSFISPEGILQLNNFIFVLAVMQIVYSVLTMALGRAKMRRWEAWERETETIEYQVANDPNRFRYTRQTTFVRRHMNSFTRTSLHLWIKCFFRQFFNSVAKVDYLTLRHGFISAHMSTNNSFDFQKYIQRSLDEDFKAVVGISPSMWFIVVVFILLDVHGWHMYLWLSFLPLILVLLLGTKLEVIVARMALQLKDQNSVIKGTPVVQLKDSHFWFNRPKFFLNVLHFTLFTNAFELAFFVWVTWQYGIKSCYHENIEIIVVRVALAVTVQVLCSYITLPLYALVTQMGSQFKSRVGLEGQTVHAINQWYVEARERRKKRQDVSVRSGSSSNRTLDSLDLPSHHHHRVLTISNEGEIEAHVSNELADEIVEEQYDQGVHDQDHDEEGLDQAMDSTSEIVQIEMSEASISNSKILESTGMIS
ncbi:MLO-like protein 3 [Juglans microcarpa x Juglans regia]|uniref:MLO-like protein 3 n=1 Tax=Juglans microcarpa x Juglans regia TaxID=2249226 RepID=UPI001B7E32EF|nr:MLO-like protein 3 [Juglans microcarpa x Juglans regia]XP_040991040.1 MLO-like protein 3 [Juglans microcarpa x Juglans regia]XP_040991041.1 MLO-like protein 3 [Juglans microcarpa x Juglans regia]